MAPQKERFSSLPLVERDESWLYFNHRILLEARRKDVPLKERLNFLSIYSNNIDEFFRVRVASQQRMAINKKNPKRTRTKALQTLQRIYEIVADYAKEFETAFNEIIKELEQEGIYIVDENNITSAQRKEVTDIYLEKLNGSINPIYLDRIKFSSDEMDEALYLAVDLRKKDKKGISKSSDIALIQLPTESFGRFIRLKNNGSKIYIMFLDDVIRVCMPYIFIGKQYASFDAYAFKFTKNAEMDVEEDIGIGVMERVYYGLEKRTRGDMLRIVLDREMPHHIEKALIDFAEIDKYDSLIKSNRYHNSKDLMTFPDVERSEYTFSPLPPLMGPCQDFSESIIDKIFQKDIGLHVPYRRFDPFLSLLREVAINDDVKEIKITLYRVAKDSNVIKALLAAAANGKKVTAVIELFARFDEARNIAWSKKMEAAGIRVLFGPEELKVHAKLCYIRTSRGNIACIGTGNMHEVTAKLYTDYMLMTARKNIVSEVLKVFNFIEHPFVHHRYRELMVSPINMKEKILRLIDFEINSAKAGQKAFIKVKINHITDEQIIAKLYAASQAGVSVELLVRGNCSLVPDVKGTSDHIIQHGIIARFLEHSRILIFAHAGNPKFFIGSADWMERNLKRRIEVMTPVYDPAIQEELMTIVEYGLKDTSQSHYVNYNDRIPLRYTHEKPLFHSQEALYSYYIENERNNLKG